MARLLLLTVVLAALVAAPAAAQSLKTSSPVTDAATALRNGATVYVHPDARDELSDADASALQSQIDRQGGGVYAVVLPSSAGSGNLALQIGREVRRSGTYVVDAGGSWSAASSDLRAGEAPQLVQDASQGREDDAAGTLNAFVASVADARGSRPASSGNGGGGGIGGGVIAVLAVLAGGGGLLAWRARRRRRQREEAELAQLRETAGDDLAALGDDIRALDLDVEMPGVDPHAKERYGQAVDAYTRAEEGLDLARRADDFTPIGQALEEGRWAMEAAKARFAGRPEPERRPPCFFDPRHGPSVTDALWQPSWGQPREVPVCAADAVRLEEGEEPASREVVVGGERMPYWQAPGYYGGYYAGGMFGGFGGFLPGLLFGSLLGGGFGGFGGIDTAGASGWDDGGLDGGDFGGGDFGGGDFGGGDFGGGDFGGG